MTEMYKILCEKYDPALAPQANRDYSSEWGHMKFSGTHWKCIEYLTSLVPLIDEK